MGNRNNIELAKACKCLFLQFFFFFTDPQKFGKFVRSARVNLESLNATQLKSVSFQIDILPKNVPFCRKIKMRKASQPAVVAEWLRRWTRNPMGFPRAGSNPAHSVMWLLYVFDLALFQWEMHENIWMAVSTPKLHTGHVKDQSVVVTRVTPNKP